MAKEMIWYEVLDLTAYGIKYPNDWYDRCGKHLKLWEAPVCESLGVYSTQENAVNRLKKWANDKGIDYEENKYEPETKWPFYEGDFIVECIPVVEVGLYFNLRDEQTTNREGSCYSTSAMIIKKTMELDKDWD